MARATFGLLLGFVLVFGVAYWARACLPDPGGSEIEWLQREDAIIVQMRVSGGMPQPEILERLIPPAFTLYGDGTLVVAEPADYDYGFVQTTLSPEQVQDMVEFIEGTGFLDFSYEQPTPGPYDQPTTFFYLNTIGAANSVSAYALGMGPKDGGSEWSQFHHLETIRARLMEIASAARVGTNVRDYKSEGGVLLAVQKLAHDLLGVPPWPYAEVEVPFSRMVDGISEVGQLTLSPDEVAILGLGDPRETKCWNSVQYNDALVDVCYRPILLYEENFPEFGPPLHGPAGTPIPSPPS